MDCLCDIFALIGNDLHKSIPARFYLVQVSSPSDWSFSHTNRPVDLFTGVFTVPLSVDLHRPAPLWQASVPISKMSVKMEENVSHWSSPKERNPNTLWCDLLVAGLLLAWQMQLAFQVMMHAWVNPSGSLAQSGAYECNLMQLCYQNFIHVFSFDML